MFNELRLCALLSIASRRRGNLIGITARCKMRRVRRIATNLAVLPDGSLLIVNDQGQVPNLWIRRRAIRVLQ